MSARIVGIVNVTPDSFSDGGLYERPQDAVRHGLELLHDGADELDVGGESTRPDADPVSVAAECARVAPVIKGLRAAGVTAPISIDSFHPETARAALEAGADGINDVTGFRDPAMRLLAAEAGARCVVMYGPADGRPGPETQARPDFAATVDFLQAQAALLREAGVAAERIALDPGFGFSGSRDDDIKLFGQMPHVAGDFVTSPATSSALYVGLSRKRFLRVLFGEDRPLGELDQASAELSAALAAAGARYLRVHDAGATRRELDRLATQPPQTAYVALGSNIEPGEAHLRAALYALAALPATTLDAVAPTYLSEPAYYRDQPPFYNTVARLKTRLGPRALFAELQAAERLAGRVKTVLNGPRNIDLDLLSYGDVILKTEALVLPHPRIAQRAFVVEPLLALDPDYRFPTGLRLSREAECQGAIIKVLPVLAPGEPFDLQR
ncbi:MAG: dihydropteroate synthase [Actinomycetia bacterium]|nr:dihydropteroate synthase [Actinomycetes bacterium]